MLELLLCSLLTILPDYLFRRYVQGKRLGREITFYSVWYELRWGITACLMLTVGLITVVFYYHPSTKTATLFFRTVPIVPETIGRVAEINVGMSDEVAQGQPLFRLDNSKQRAAVETARRKITEVDAGLVVARTDILEAEGKIQEARSAHQQALDELETKQELFRRNPGIVPRRDIEKLQVAVDGRQAAITAATAAKQGAEAKMSSLLPAEKASAEAELSQAEVELAKTIIRAGVRWTGGAIRFARRRHRQSVDASGRRPDPGGRRSAKPSGRLRTDRGSGHEDRHGGRGHLRIEALGRYPHGGHGRPGLHCRWPVPRRRIADRRTAGFTTGNHPRLPRAYEGGL